MKYGRLEVVGSYQYGGDRADGCDHNGICCYHRSWCGGYTIRIAIHVVVVVILVRIDDGDYIAAPQHGTFR